MGIFEEIKKDTKYLEKKEQMVILLAFGLFLIFIFLCILTSVYFDLNNLATSMILFLANVFFLFFFLNALKAYSKIKDILNEIRIRKEYEEWKICPPELKEEVRAKQHEIYHKKKELEELSKEVWVFLPCLVATGSFFVSYKGLKYLNLPTFLNCLISYILAVVVFFVVFLMLFDSEKVRKLEQEIKQLEKEIEELIKIKSKEKKIFINWISF